MTYVRPQECAASGAGHRDAKCGPNGEVQCEYCGEAPPPREPCNLAKPGWRCKREKGHEGPCAAVPVGFMHRLYWRYRMKMWNID